MRITLRNSRARAAGLSLIEGLIALLIVELAAVAVSYAVVAGHRHVRHGGEVVEVAHLAEDLIEEIQALAYADPEGGATPGPDAGESARASFDNMDDFHGYTENPGQLRDANGQLYPEAMQTLKRSVTATYQTQTIAGLGAGVDGLRIVVTIEDPQGKQWTVTRFFPES